MARQRKTKRNQQEDAIYICVNPCVLPVGVDREGNTVHKLYRTAGEVAYSADHLKEGGLDDNDCVLKVPKGTIVPHHFVPDNDTAFDDREDQLNNPEKYVNDDCDLAFIAELMVAEGWFKDKHKNDEKGRRVLEKTAEQVASEAIKEMMGAEKAAAIEVGENQQRIVAFNKLMKLGKDEKETKSMVIKILKDADIKMFWGAELEALVNRVLDEELYEG